MWLFKKIKLNWLYQREFQSIERRSCLNLRHICFINDNNPDINLPHQITTRHSLLLNLPPPSFFRQQSELFQKIFKFLFLFWILDSLPVRSLWRRREWPGAPVRLWKECPKFKTPYCYTSIASR